LRIGGKQSKAHKNQSWWRKTKNSDETLGSSFNVQRFKRKIDFVNSSDAVTDQNGRRRINAPNQRLNNTEDKTEGKQEEEVKFVYVQHDCKEQFFTAMLEKMEAQDNSSQRLGMWMCTVRQFCSIAKKRKKVKAVFAWLKDCHHKSERKVKKSTTWSHATNQFKIKAFHVANIGPLTPPIKIPMTENMMTPMQKKAKTRRN